MPILYGEGEAAAFQRLQLEVIRLSSDHSIFAWRSHRERSGLLAQSPRDYDLSLSVVPYHDCADDSPYSMTNQGLKISLWTEREGDSIIGWLDCALEVDEERKRIGLPLKHVVLYWQAGKETLHCFRHRCDLFWLKDIKEPESEGSENMEDTEKGGVNGKKLKLFVKEDMLLDTKCPE